MEGQLVEQNQQDLRLRDHQRLKHRHAEFRFQRPEKNNTLVHDSRRRLQLKNSHRSLYLVRSCLGAAHIEMRLFHRISRLVAAQSRRKFSQSVPGVPCSARASLGIEDNRGKARRNLKEFGLHQAKQAEKEASEAEYIAGVVGFVQSNQLEKAYDIIEGRIRLDQTCRLLDSQVFPSVLVCLLLLKKYDLFVKVATDQIRSIRTSNDSKRLAEVVEEFNDAMELCSRLEKQIQPLLFLFDFMKQQNSFQDLVNVRSFNIIFKATENSGVKSPELVKAFLSAMKERKIDPNMETYSVLFNLIALNKDESLFQEILKEISTHIDKLYKKAKVSLVKVYASLGYHEKAMELLVKFDKEDLLSEASIFTTLLEESDQSISKINDILEIISHKNMQIPVECQDIVLRLLSKSPGNYDQCKELFSQVTEESVSPEIRLSASKSLVGSSMDQPQLTDAVSCVKKFVAAEYFLEIYLEIIQKSKKLGLVQYSSMIFQEFVDSGMLSNLNLPMSDHCMIVKICIEADREELSVPHLSKLARLRSRIPVDEKVNTENLIKRVCQGLEKKKLWSEVSSVLASATFSEMLELTDLIKKTTLHLLIARKSESALSLSKSVFEKHLIFPMDELFESIVVLFSEYGTGRDKYSLLKELFGAPEPSNIIVSSSLTSLYNSLLIVDEDNLWNSQEWTFLNSLSKYFRSRQ